MVSEFTVYRIHEDGKTTHFESELCLNEVNAASMLRPFLRRKQHGAAGLFIHPAYRSRAIDKETFIQRAVSYQHGDPNIHGIISIDIDADTFTFLTPNQGWLRYTIKDVSVAGSLALNSTYRTLKSARRIFYRELHGKELPLPSRRFYEQDVPLEDHAPGPEPDMAALQ